MIYCKSFFLFIIKRSIAHFFRSCLVYHRALSGNLFLQKDNQHQGLIKNHFSTEDLKMIHKATKSEIKSGKISFNQNLYFSVKEAIDVNGNMYFTHYKTNVYTCISVYRSLKRMTRNWNSQSICSPFAKLLTNMKPEHLRQSFVYFQNLFQ